MSDDKKCCDHVSFEGYFTSLLKDSLRFNFSKSIAYRQLQNEKSEFNPLYLNDYSNIAIAKKDIVRITEYSSKKNMKARKNLVGIGGLIIFTGIVTSLNALIFAGNKKNDMLIAGGVQLGTGIVLVKSSIKRKRQFTLYDDPWRIK